MLRVIGRFVLAFAAYVCFASAHALATQPRARSIDLVIALDVSGSMSGLIDSAKQRLWDIVNELGRAQPQPALRIAILSFGRPSYGGQNGYVRIDQPFTDDLDAVNETLFAFTTNGGNEYVARAIHRSVNELQWSNGHDNLRMLFVAGNESARQDPLISVEAATEAALAKGIVVNTIYCGNQGDNISGEWLGVATMSGGAFASIDQHAAALANIATPMDQRLHELSGLLNSTYVAYGQDGQRAQANQMGQDLNAATMSAPAAASRAVAKASALYSNASWDLVDALAEGKELAAIDTADLPTEIQAMDAQQREAYVHEKAEQRAALREEIAKLDKDRRLYIADQRALQKPGVKGLDEAILASLREMAKKKGFSFSAN